MVQGSRFGGSHAHFDVTRAAKHAACDGNGKGKQCHKGKGKENVKGFHTLPVPSHWLHGAEVIPWNEFGFKFGLHEVLPYPSHSSHVSGSTAVGISISLGKSNFVFISWFGLVWFGYCWRALFAGNGINLKHGGNIANNYLRISENIFHQFSKIRLTSHQTP
jgi:hypothetical protein